MTRLKIVASAVVVETPSGRFSARAQFQDGLNVISAHNSSGKTTLLMGIIYALGLEGMLGPGHQMPLKPAAYELLLDEHDEELPILSSYAAVELENGNGDRLTAQRYLLHERYRSDLVRTWQAGMLTDPNQEAQEIDQYTRVPGSATNRAGWHTSVERFIGWQLPEVTTYNGESRKLYLQTVMPLLFREQTRGWSGVLNAVPRHFQIRDPGRRAVEFLLSLDGYERARRREELRTEEALITAEWRSEVETFARTLDSLGARLEGMDSHATVDWPPAVAPTVQVFETERWRSLPLAIASAQADLTLLEREEVPRAAEVVDQTRQQLDEAEQRLSRTNALWNQIGVDVRLQNADVDALVARLEALSEDRIRYSDALKLRDLGALEPLASDAAHCPTCEQILPATLHGSTLVTPVLTLEMNLEIIDADRENVRAMLADARAVLDASRSRARALHGALDDARRQVRTLKSALVQNANAPSRAVIAQQVRLADRLETLGNVEWRFGELLEDLNDLADRLRRVRGDLAAVSTDQSARDRAKLDALGASVREQLAVYGYGSFIGVGLDYDSYLPAREGFNLESASSASDTVRLVWAYTAGLLEVARSADTNHPGLLMLDEPGQHQMEPDSVRALLARLSHTADYGQQAIVATSLDFETVDHLSKTYPMSVQRFDGKVLSREDGAP